MMTWKNVAIVLAMVAVGGVSYAAGTAAAKKGMATSADALVWEEMGPGSPLKLAKLWGDRNKGEYGMFLKMPAGAESGFHAHTGDYHGVNVAGTWVHTFEGDTEAKELPVGSYVMQPGKQMHNDQCKGTTDCVIFITQKVKGDFIPKAEPAKKTN